MSYETVHSETIFRGRVFNIRQDQIRLPEGQLVQLDIVDHRSAVTLIPLDDHGQIWFVRQYRHPAKQVLLELPAGVMDEGETPEVSASREIREEIGMAAGQLREIGTYFLAPGYSTEYMHVFLATGLRIDPLQGDEDEQISVEKIPVHQAYSLAEAGQIQDAKSLAALFLARPHLNRSGGSMLLAEE
jgi:ADP-ribose pyrophosphatase